MDFIVKRFPTLAVNISKNLDDQSLVNFKDANRENYVFMDQERFYWIRILKRYSEHFETSKKSWNISISKTSAGFVKKLAMAVLTYFNEEADPEERLYRYFGSVHVPPDQGGELTQEDPRQRQHRRSGEGSTVLFEV